MKIKTWSIFKLNKYDKKKKKLLKTYLNPKYVKRYLK